MEALDSQINVRLSLETIESLRHVRSLSRNQSHLSFCTNQYPTQLLGRSDSAFARFILETSLHSLTIVLQYDELISEVVDLFLNGKKKNFVQNKLINEHKLSSEFALMLIALAWQRPSLFSSNIY